MVLPDLLKTELFIVFCGTAVGDKSAENQAYYAGNGNQFYSTLYEIGLTDKILQPYEYPKLLEYNIGLSDLAKKVHGTDSNIKKSDYDVAGFKNKILKYKPKVVCFNGKEAAKQYFNKKSTGDINYGLQEELLGDTILYVAPSTSGSARGFWDINIWGKLKQLKQIIEK